MLGRKRLDLLGKALQERVTSDVLLLRRARDWIFEHVRQGLGERLQHFGAAGRVIDFRHQLENLIHSNCTGVHAREGTRRPGQRHQHALEAAHLVERCP